MAGTIEGGKKAAKLNTLYDSDFYRRIGAMGGKKGKTGGFASDKPGKDGMSGRERARIAGALGGRTSKRGKADD